MVEKMSYKQEILDNGFSIANGIYTIEEIDNILTILKNIDTSKETFRKSNDLFAIRQFLKEVPEIFKYIFTDNLKEIMNQTLGKDFFIVKSIYFDKPPTSNWFVSYHQDLTISVDKKLELDDFTSWTIKQNQFAVQPPIDILKNITTIRIHLDDTDENNGALKVIPESHLKRVCNSEMKDNNISNEVICNVNKGGIMFMKPLILHSSSRTTNNKRRRVIHIEFSNKELPTGLEWSERLELNSDLKS